MITKSDDLRRSLSDIEHLLQALRAAGAGDEIEIEEIELLERSRRSVVTLLESRRRQNLSPIVSLQAWRDGNLVAVPFAVERYAALAAASRPQPGARPYRVL